MTSKEKMDEIVKMMGQTEARLMVMRAYDTELICNRLGRLEEQQAAGKLSREKRNLLDLAIDRVHAVVTFGG